MRVSVLVRPLLAATAALAVIAAPISAAAHGDLDYHIIEYHYVMIGPYYYVQPYAQHLYYCDGHYEYTQSNGQSAGLAYTQEYDDGDCS